MCLSFCSYRTGSEKRGRRKGGAKTVAYLHCRARTPLEQGKKKFLRATTTVRLSTTYTSPAHSKNTRILRRVARRSVEHKLFHQQAGIPCCYSYVVTWTRLPASWRSDTTYN